MNNLLNRVDAELEIAKELNPVMAMGMIAIRKMIVEEDQNSISFRRLNGLTPTTESCTMKVLEEVGELMQLLGKGRGASGEDQAMEDAVLSINTAFEALDVAQAAVTLFNVLVDMDGLEGEEMVARHEAKLREKGYLV